MSATKAVELIALPDGVTHSLLERRLPAGRFSDKTGMQCGPYEIVGFAGFIKGASAWLARCQCGTHRIVRSSYFNGDYPAGCSHSGDYKHSIYKIWVLMRHRCYNKNNPSFGDYGGRGIGICKRWRDSFSHFVEDMGPRPGPEYSIDRIDNDGDYCPENCRWATQKQQCNNTRRNRTITYHGVTKTHSQWADTLAISRERFRQRVNKLESIGADVTQAITTPAGETMPALRKQTA